MKDTLLYDSMTLKKTRILKLLIVLYMHRVQQDSTTLKRTRKPSIYGDLIKR